MGEIVIDKKIIGSFANMQKVLDNWKELDPGCVTASRRDYIELTLGMGHNIWDHHIALVWLLEKLKVESYLEVGVLTCGSTVHSFCSPHCKRVVGVDAFGNTYAGGKYIKNKNVLTEIVMKQAAKFDKSIIFHKGLSHIELPKIEESFDLALVDGDHSEGGAMIDLELVLPKVKKAMVMDDIHHQSHVYLEDVALVFAAKHKLDYTINHQPPGTVIFWVDQNLI